MLLRCIYKMGLDCRVKFTIWVALFVNVILDFVAGSFTGLISVFNLVEQFLMHFLIHFQIGYWLVIDET